MRVNALLVRWNGGWLERTSPAAIAIDGRCEAVLMIGHITQRAEAIRLGDATLAEYATERVQTDVTVEPLPGETWAVGDTVTLEGGASHRVLRTAYTHDANGRVTVLPTLNANLILTAEEAVRNALRRLVMGDLNGRSRIARAHVPYPSFSKAPPVTCAVFEDTFTLADGDFTGSNTDLAWNITSEDQGTFQIIDNQLTFVAGTTLFGYIGDMTSDEEVADDCFVEYDYTPGDTIDPNDDFEEVVTVLRVPVDWDFDTSPIFGITMVLFNYMDGTYEVDVWDQNPGELIAEIVTGDPTGTWRLEAEGDAVRVYLDGVLQWSATGAITTTGYNHLGVNLLGVFGVPPSAGTPSPLISRIQFGDLC